jgi:hypothetical protein
MSIGFVTLWSLAFWKFFIVDFSYYTLHIPIGPGGATYFLFFLPFVMMGNSLYQLMISRFRNDWAMKKELFISIFVPAVFTSILVLVFCPVETGDSYLRVLFSIPTVK